MHGTEPLLKRTDLGGVATVTLADPGTRNSLSGRMLEALAAELAAIEADRTIRVVVLAAEGPAFSSGHNLKEMQAARNDPDAGEAAMAALFGRCAQVMTAIVNLRVPVIAAVEGLATAAGCQLVASCDLAVAGAGARFCTPGVNNGLFCHTPAVALARNLSRKHAMQMLLTGDVIDAASAERFGLVSQVVDEGQALPTAQALAARIATRSGEAIAFGKTAFYAQAPLPLDQAYGLATEVMVRNFLAGEAKEGIAAFLEKREPNWG
jgi:enoyl-CoA hydratase/carnithine racemase